MKNNQQHQPLTIGELCSAIAEGRLSATVEDNQYQVNGRELRRYVKRQQHESEQLTPRLLRLVER
jgi:hypothetical protein